MNVSIQNNQTEINLSWALKYASLGFCVFPIWKAINGKCTCPKGDKCTDEGKHPRTRNGFHGATTDERQIKKWVWESANIGIATGAVSNLVVVDVDSDDARQCIKRELSPVPDTAIAATGGGGWHLLLQHPGGYVASSNDGKAHKDIHIRADGGYIVAPPSIHKSGNTYHWIDGRSPEIIKPAVMPADWAEKLLNHTNQSNADCIIEVKEGYRGLKRLKSLKEVKGDTTEPAPNKFGADILLLVTEQIKLSLPTGPRQRRNMLFTLARRLKAIPALKDKPAAELLPFIQQWHAQALKHIQTKDFEDSWFDFSELWQITHTPFGDGQGFLVIAREAARKSMNPKVAEIYPSEKMRFLIRLCRELQRRSKEDHFFLSSYSAGELLDIEQSRAHRWLRGLVMDGVLESIGTNSRKKPNEYRYIGD